MHFANTSDSIRELIGRLLKERHTAAGSRRSEGSKIHETEKQMLLAWEFLISLSFGFMFLKEKETRERESER